MSVGLKPWELPQVGTETGPVHRGQGETEDSSRPLQIGQGQVSRAKKPTHEACLGRQQDK